MPTVTHNIGSRSADNVTVNSVSGSSPGPYTVTLSAAVPSTTVVGDTITDSAGRTFLIEGKSGSDLTVHKRNFGAAADPATGAATTQRGYSTIASANSGILLNLTTDTLIWDLALYKEGGGTNGSWSLSLSVSLGSGVTTSASAYIIFRSATGAGWGENGSVQSNAYQANSANGVYIGGSATPLMTFSAAHTVARGLQLVGGHNSFVVSFGSNTYCENIIVTASHSDPITLGASAVARNSLVVNTLSAGAGFRWGGANGKAINCGCIKPANVTAGGVAYSQNGVTGLLIKNCYSFGFSTFKIGTLDAGSNYNASDQATVSGGANDVGSLTAANQVESLATGATVDARLKSGNSLANAGVTDATNLPSQADATGTARPQGAAWDIGPWETVVGGGGHFSMRGQGGMSGGFQSMGGGMRGSATANPFLALKYDRLPVRPSNDPYPMKKAA